MLTLLPKYGAGFLDYIALAASPATIACKADD
jgi:hypothetical protein